MATAIIPIVASAIPVLIPAIADIVKAVEGLFGAKTGPTKLQLSTDIVQTIADSLAKAGKINGIPDTSAIVTLVESVVQQLKATGQLPGPISISNPSAINGKMDVLTGSTVIIIGGVK